MGKIADRQLNQSGYVCSQIIVLNNVVGFHHSHDDLLHLIVTAVIRTTHTYRATQIPYQGYRQRRQ